MRERSFLPGPSMGALTVVARQPATALRPLCSSKDGGIRKALWTRCWKVAQVHTSGTTLGHVLRTLTSSWGENGHQIYWGAGTLTNIIPLIYRVSLFLSEAQRGQTTYLVLHSE